MDANCTIIVLQNVLSEEQLSALEVRWALHTLVQRGGSPLVD